MFVVFPMPDGLCLRSKLSSISEASSIASRRIRRVCKEQGRELLEFNVKEGCLRKEVPKGPFPKVNDSEEFKKALVVTRRQYAIGYVLNLFKVLMLLAAITVSFAFSTLR